MLSVASPEPGETGQGRLRFVDGLRGLASLSVVFFHLYFHSTSPLHATLARLPVFITSVLDRGWSGVEIFFVLSGFVIARSLRRDRITPRFLGWFALRRSVRLDPPYWVLIALVVGLKWFATLHSHGHTFFALSDYSTREILINAAYLHTLTGTRMILGVAWTLCLEILFYLTCAIGIGLSQSLSRKLDSARPSSWILLLIFYPTFVASAWCWHMQQMGQNGHDTGLHMYFGYWHMFLLGAMLQWSMSRWIDGKWFAVALLLTLAGVLHQFIYQPDNMVAAGIVASATAGALWLANRWDRWDRWLADPFFQGIGRISYSLYLVHLPIITVVLAMSLKRLGQTPKACVIGIPLALLAVTAAAMALYFLVERPSLRLSKWLKRGPAHVDASIETSA
jgi:peptidoglycan/LPS O-acetylase OafA/YrhL